ncbi:MAG: histidine triad nucleotide-binding protein [Gammaproteobacteria bacterium CG_4_10_14_0_8_um_filter_38_16]|nr:MAG: histidine triad nucleotide-binding protein [Gammaproteobacteria bacterium CG_4_10_14_0_8_um_filter_38_16]PJA02654.1 MAG: histidine triad nucleotide-binding protein [Gammaproteobacteria bacterium CG_4_10_14_0_2_um_filter_38_22]
MDCLFCKIAAGTLKTDFVYHDEQVVAFNDIAPQAPHHILIIPKKHIATINDIAEKDNALIGHMMQTAKKIAVELKIQDAGYRVIMNCNQNGGQAVYHIHFHLLGGRQMSWPPG